MKFKESDMYEPIRNLLAQQGFVVRGEVKGCDIVAVKGDALWIVEMKLAANITLIYQAMMRQIATDWVFVAIPRPKQIRDGSYLKFQKLLKKLQLGLITVALDSPLKQAEVILFPIGRDNKANKKTAVIKREVAGRTVDTTGGAAKMPVNTAYRERCVRIACLLDTHGPLTAKELVNTHGCAKDTSHIMRTNVLGWFAKLTKGVYVISETGRGYLKTNASTTLVAYYAMKARNEI